MEEVELYAGRIILVKGEDVRRVGLPDWDLHYLEGCEDPFGVQRLLKRAGARVEHQSGGRIYFTQPVIDRVPEDAGGGGDPPPPETGERGPEDATGLGLAS